MDNLRQIILTITLNVNNLNNLNILIKRQRMSDQIKKQDLAVCCLQETHFKYKNISSLKIKRIEKDIKCCATHKKTRVPILISDKTDFTTRNITSDKEEHFIINIMIKEPIHLEDITLHKTNRQKISKGTNDSYLHLQLSDMTFILSSSAISLALLVISPLSCFFHCQLTSFLPLESKTSSGLFHPKINFSSLTLLS